LKVSDDEPPFSTPAPPQFFQAHILVKMVHGALGINHLGMGTGRIEELSIGKLTVDFLVVKKRSEG
jgi:hypothetical protein